MVSRSSMYIVLFRSPVKVENRSMMNVPFVFAEQGDESSFLSYCNQRGLQTLKGHRSIGGFRASIYNAMPTTGVEQLASFMVDFRNKNS